MAPSLIKLCLSASTVPPYLQALYNVMTFIPGSNKTCPDLIRSTRSHLTRWHVAVPQRSLHCLKTNLSPLPLTPSTRFFKPLSDHHRNGAGRANNSNRNNCQSSYTIPAAILFLLAIIKCLTHFYYALVNGLHGLCQAQDNVDENNRRITQAFVTTPISVIAVN